MVFNVANNSTFRDRSERKNIANHEIGFLSAENELASVHAFGGDKELLLVLESEGVAERDSSQRRTATWVVDDLGDHALQVAVALAEVEAAEPSWTLAVVGVGLEYGPSTLTLSSDHTTHLSLSLSLSL